MIDKIDNADVIVISGGLARAKKWREKREGESSQTAIRFSKISILSQRSISVKS